MCGNYAFWPRQEPLLTGTGAISYCTTAGTSGGRNLTKQVYKSVSNRGCFGLFMGYFGARSGIELQWDLARSVRDSVVTV